MPIWKESSSAIATTGAPNPSVQRAQAIASNEPIIQSTTQGARYLGRVVAELWEASNGGEDLAWLVAPAKDMDDTETKQFGQRVARSLNQTFAH